MPRGHGGVKAVAQEAGGKQKAKGKVTAQVDLGMKGRWSPPPEFDKGYGGLGLSWEVVEVEPGTKGSSRKTRARASRAPRAFLRAVEM